MPAERQRLATEAAERERIHKEQLQRAETDRRAHDARVAAHEDGVGWPAVQARISELEKEANKYRRFHTYSAEGANAWLFACVVGALVAAITTQIRGLLLVALLGLLAVPKIRRWRLTLRAGELRKEISQLQALRGCGDGECAKCHTT